MPSAAASTLATSVLPTPARPRGTAAAEAQRQKDRDGQAAVGDVVLWRQRVLQLVDRRGRGESTVQASRPRDPSAGFTAAARRRGRERALDVDRRHRARGTRPTRRCRRSHRCRDPRPTFAAAAAIAASVSRLPGQRRLDRAGAPCAATAARRARRARRCTCRPVTVTSAAAPTTA